LLRPLAKISFFGFRKHDGITFFGLAMTINQSINQNLFSEQQKCITVYASAQKAAREAYAH